MELAAAAPPCGAEILRVRIGPGLEIGDPLFRIAVHQPGVPGFEEEHPVGVGSEEVRRDLEAHAGVLQDAVEPDRHGRPGLHDDHLLVAIYRPGEAWRREFDGMDSYRIAASVHQQGFRRIAVGSLIQDSPSRVGHLQDKVVRVRDFRRRRPGPGPAVTDDPPQFPLPSGPEPEVVTRAQCRHQRQERPQSFESHSLASFTGRTPCPAECENNLPGRE